MAATYAGGMPAVSPSVNTYYNLEMLADVVVH